MTQCVKFHFHYVTVKDDASCKGKRDGVIPSYQQSLSCQIDTIYYVNLACVLCLQPAIARFSVAVGLGV